MQFVNCVEVNVMQTFLLSTKLNEYTVCVAMIMLNESHWVRTLMLFCLFRTALVHDLLFYDDWCNNSFIIRVYRCIWKSLIGEELLIFTYLFIHPRNVRKWRQHQKNQKKKTDEEQKTDTDIVDSAGMDSPKQTADDIDILDNTECKFNVNSFKIVLCCQQRILPV